jgi:hypothetical protein
MDERLNLVRNWFRKADFVMDLYSLLFINSKRGVNYKEFSLTKKKVL